MDNVFVAVGNTGIGHTYSEKNKEYTVTITGKCETISTISMECTPEKIIEVLQWGKIGLKEIKLINCTNLRKIATSTENSFADVQDFIGTFAGCTSLTSIPENLFANCPNVQDFSYTFSGCTSLTSIPENLFANCPNVQNFNYTFYKCTNLKGNPIPLWERVENGSSNGYFGEPDGGGCYYRCENLNNYYDIPEYWRMDVFG